MSHVGRSLTVARQRLMTLYGRQSQEAQRDAAFRVCRGTIEPVPRGARAPIAAYYMLLAEDPPCVPCRTITTIARQRLVTTYGRQSQVAQTPSSELTDFLTISWSHQLAVGFQQVVESYNTPLSPPEPPTDSLHPRPRSRGSSSSSHPSKA